MSHDIGRCMFIDMYSMCTESYVKEAIAHAFSVPNGNFRVIITTIVSDIGLDCPDVHQFIHWGPSHDHESCTKKW